MRRDNTVVNNNNNNSGSSEERNIEGEVAPDLRSSLRAHPSPECSAPRRSGAECCRLQTRGCSLPACSREKTKKHKRFFSRRQLINYESLQVHQNLKLLHHCCFCVMFLLRMQFHHAPCMTTTQEIQFNLWLEVEFFLPHCLDMLPAGDASHGSFLLLGSAVHRQQLGRDRTAPRLTASLRCC